MLQIEPTHAIAQFITAEPRWDVPFTGIGSEAQGSTYYRWLDGTEELATDGGDTIAVKRFGIVTVPDPETTPSPRAKAMRVLARTILASLTGPTDQAIRRWT